MSAKRSSRDAAFAAAIEGKRTWIEIDAAAARANLRELRRRTDGSTGLTAGPVRLWAVVKSNAYGHGLIAFSRIMDQAGIDGFCVDSVLEGFALRREGVRRPILVLGATLPVHYDRAAKEDVAVSVATPEALRAIAARRSPPRFHLKFDTGMHRQGFFAKDSGVVLRAVRRSPRLLAACAGVFTHFASAKDMTYPGYTERQYLGFLSIADMFRRAVPHGIVAHAAATGGFLLDPRYHLDAVRIGMGLYGHSPSPELAIQVPSLRLRPVLSWRTVVAEIKPLAAGDYVGYDLTERITRATTAAVLPIGYWHGFPRALSGIGTVLVRGRSCRVLGRVSMDMTVVDLGKGARCRVGDHATIIGRDGGEAVLAPDVARKIGTSHYELLTRINPLIERVVV